MKNIYLIGPMGAGKSTIGKYLSGILGVDFFDTDRVVEKRSGASLSWIFDVEGEEGFQKRESKVLEDLSKYKGIVVATGGKTVVLKENREILKKGIVVYLKLNINTQFERTVKDSRRPQLDQKDYLKDTLESLKEQLNPLYEDIADYIFETNQQSAKSISQSIAEIFKQELI